jgi:diaminopimelate epimerase
MKMDFFKYQGAGNDFVIIDNRRGLFPKKDQKRIERLCDRKFGVGADGLMLLEDADGADFKMIYYNADGKEGSMCGNGGRCIVAFAKTLNIFDQNTTFEALGEMYSASLQADQVSLKMIDVNKIEIHPDHVFLDTGSPHHIEFTDDLSKLDVFNKGREIRYGAPYFEAGSNVNFVEKINENTFKVRTYERGVENETLSCGTGVTASALACYHMNKTPETSIDIDTLGGKLHVDFDKQNGIYSNIILTGPATFVYQGTIKI